MIIFAAILFFLLVLIIKVSIIIYVAPILLGLIILVVGNLIRKSKHGRFSPVWWDILSVVITILSASLLWNDIIYEAYDYGFAPFLILIIYGMLSFCFLALAGSHKENVLSQPKPKVTPKKISASKHEIVTYTNSASRLTRVRKNLIVVNDIFEACGISFKCNLIEEYDTLQLNVELSNTKTFVDKYGKYTDFIIKANVYDKHDNLLCIEELWFEYSQLRQDYIADYFYFTNENMDKVHSMKVYAVLLNEDDEEEL